jgi:predicted ATPase/class 3 adenylate cyclase
MHMSADNQPPAGPDGPADDLTRNPGVIATTVLSGVIAVAVAAAEWVGSGEPLGSAAGILWSVVALLGVVAMLLGTALELRRRRRAGRPPATVGAATPAEPRPGRAQAPALPTGTVTFLFTDIEGSTRLLQELGDRYPALRDEHAAILRRAIRDRDGVEVSTEGDSFFAAFARPVAAVEAAVAAQRGLAAHRWPPGLPVRVRMGLHTGEGVLGGDNYVGIDVNRAARIAGAANGGQVIVSGATRGLVEQAVADGIVLRDLGEHRLRDLNLPIHLYDLVIEGLPADFLPPRTLDARPGNLPTQLTSFVGREHEIAEARRLLERTRLLTLTGAGGTGKSRLALQVAAELQPEYRDGAFFADLSSVTDPALVPPLLARALRVPEVPGRPVMAALTDHLRDRRLLLVADNFEQVTAAGPVVEELLTAAPGLTVLATSRVALSLRGEQELVVPPLALPDRGQPRDLEALRRSDAVRLFTERARAVQPRFELTEQNAPAVADITARLDGLPLAIELAATRTKVLSPEQILPRLERRLSLLTAGNRTLPDRQRTLRGAIAWSHDLLEPAERRLFERLSVFSGGWTLASAEAVADPAALGLDALDAMTSLVDQSLVVRTGPAGGDPRFAMLETIREFGRERLAADGELEAVARGHAEHFLGLAVAAEPHLTGPDQGEWLDRCELEHANLGAALRWAVDAGETERAQEAAGAIWRFWQQRGHLTEGRRWFEELLALPSGQAPTRARTRALAGAGGLAWWQEDLGAAAGWYEEALAIERERGDPAGIAEALYNQSFVVAAAGDFDGAFRRLQESSELARRAGDELATARAEWMLVIRDLAAGNWERPLAVAGESVERWRRLGDRLQLADTLVWLAVVYARAGRPADARAAIGEALGLFRELDSPLGMVSVTLGYAYLARWEGRYRDAVRLAGAAESLREQVGGRPPLEFLAGFIGDPEAEARARLPEADARAAWEEGGRLGLDETLAVAGRPGA